MLGKLVLFLEGEFRTDHILEAPRNIVQELFAMWIVTSLVLILSVLPPAIYYRKMNKFTQDYSKNQKFGDLPDITVILPVKNEALNVERKIEEVSSMKYPGGSVEYLIVDSGSTDNTLEIASSRIKMLENSDCWSVIQLERPGKTLAIKRAIAIVKTEFFVMMDADTICPEDSLERLMRWFADPEIGAICGHQNVSDSDHVGPYRVRFNKLRMAESAFFSTPIFEGSLCAFRIDAIENDSLDPEINADDSQMAMTAIDNGFRAFMDPDLSFDDLGSQKSRKRKVRRAQGLTRVLLRFRKIGKKNIKIRSIIYNSIYFYVLMPWFVLLSMIIFTISSFLTVSSLSGILAFFVAISWALSFSFGIMSRFGRMFLDGISILIESHIRLLLGQRLQVWDTSRVEL